MNREHAETTRLLKNTAQLAPRRPHRGALTGLLSAATLSLLLLASPARAQGEDTLAMVDEALSQLAEGRLDAATASLAKAEESKPDTDVFAQGRLAAAQGEISLARGDRDEARMAFDRAARLFEGHGDDAWLGVTKYRLGQLDVQAGHDARAAASFSAAVEAFVRVDDIDGDPHAALRWRAEALMAHGRALRSDTPDTASARFTKAAELYRQLSDLESEGDAWYFKGLAEWDMEKLNRAASTFERALRAYREGDDQLGIALAHTALGRVRLSESEFEDARVRFKWALGQLERIEDVATFELVARFGMAEALVGLNRYEEAQGEFEAASKLATSLGAAGVHGQVAMSAGLAYSAAGQNDEARTRLQTAIERFGDAGFEKQRTHIHLVLGQLEVAAENPAKAREHFELAVSLGGERSAHTTQARIGLGEVLIVEGKLDEADALLSRAASTLDRKDYGARARVYLARAGVAVSRDENKRAHALYDDAADAFGDAKDVLGEGKAMLAEGRLYASEDETRKAKKLYEKAIRAFVAAGPKRYIGEARHAFADLLVKDGDEEEALLEYKLAAEAYEAINYTAGIGMTQLAVARLEAAKGNMETALAGAEQASKAIEESNDPSKDGELAKADAVLLVGELRVAAAKDGAEAPLRQGIELARKHGRNDLLARGLVNLAALLRESKPAEAKTLVEEGLPLAEALTAPELQGDAYYTKGLLLLDAKDPQSADLLENAYRAYKTAKASAKSREARNARRKARRL